jgi:PAS domain S-box-containing protein
MLGYTYDEFLTMKVEDIDPCMKVEEIDNVRERVNEFTTTTFQTNHRTKDGRILDVEITVTKFIFNDTDLRLSIVKDITQQIRYEQEIKELNRILEQKSIEEPKNF